ncbi:hypothetical protein PIB30_059069 [Stylosanthes scabra]|uniref:Uncharacterized protein n=1 Tax=Stylosanthes scabra TaxID=79078 RepID=A0ABU6SK81_9FABA|nr:hypothetical protein [Stylosanthes scabra]
MPLLFCGSFFATAGGLQCQSTILFPVQKAQFMPTSSGFQSLVIPQSSANATELSEVLHMEYDVEKFIPLN